MSTDLQAVIEPAVRAALAPTAVDAVAVEQRPDHADEDSLFITVTLPPGTPLVGGAKYMAAMTLVSTALLTIGERRFPYMRLDHTGEAIVEEASRSEASLP